MFLVHADVQITRRKAMSIVYNPQGDAVFHGGKLMECLVWLHEQEVNYCQVDNGLHRYTLTIATVIEGSRPWTGSDTPA